MSQPITRERIIEVQDLRDRDVIRLAGRSVEVSGMTVLEAEGEVNFIGTGEDLQHREYDFPIGLSVPLVHRPEPKPYWVAWAQTQRDQALDQARRELAGLQQTIDQFRQALEAGITPPQGVTGGFYLTGDARKVELAATRYLNMAEFLRVAEREYPMDNGDGLVPQAAVS